MLLNLVLKEKLLQTDFLIRLFIVRYYVQRGDGKHSVVLTYFELTKGTPIIRPCEHAMRESFVSFWKKWILP